MYSVLNVVILRVQMFIDFMIYSLNMLTEKIKALFSCKSDLNVMVFDAEASAVMGGSRP